MEDNLVERFHEAGMFYFVLASLVSSDSIFSKQDVLESMETLKKLENDLNNSSLNKWMKTRYRNKIKECYAVLESDLKRFNGDRG